MPSFVTRLSVIFSTSNIFVKKSTRKRLQVPKFVSDRAVVDVAQAWVVSDKGQAGPGRIIHR